MATIFKEVNFILNYLIVFVLCILSVFNAAGQGLLTEAEFRQSIDERYHTINRIEGIYDVNMKLGAPTINCSYCNYSDYTINKFDRIAIVFNKGLYEIYSFKNNQWIGSVKKSGDPKNDFGFANILFDFKAKNYPSSNISSSYISGSIGYTSEFHIDNLYNVLDNNIAKYVKLKCNSPMSRTSETICLNTAVNLEFQKVFPDKDFKPKPIVKTGTGFLINKEGIVLTNYHVVENPLKRPGSLYETIELKNDNDSTFKFAKIIHFDKELDIAVLQILVPPTMLKNILPVKLNPNELEIGTNVSTIGYPFGPVAGNTVKFTKGYVSSNVGIYNSPKHYTTDLGINPGNSGGPLFDNKYHVAAMICARLSDEAIGAKVENISYSIKIAEIIKFLDNCKIKYSKVSSDKEVGRSINDAKKGVYMIRYTGETITSRYF
jgi:S1-C subfamily serine protease